jgi:prepilin signal peptidase PulO-like enzyme (type II secretory pathway)
MPGAIAFSDVKVTALASGAAAAAAWRLVVVMLCLSCVVNAGYVVLAAWRRGPPLAADRPVPFVPGLAVSFVVAVSLW